VDDGRREVGDDRRAAARASRPSDDPHDVAAGELTVASIWSIRVAPPPASERELRLFAVWCARRAWRHAGCDPFRVLVEAVEARVRGELSEGALEALWRRFGGAAAAACIQGVNRGFPSASAQLAAFQAARPDPVEAAWQTIHHTAQAAGFAANQRAVENGTIQLRPEDRASSCALACARRADPRFYAAAERAEQALLEWILHDRLKVLGK
jgi:hypothetical protein